jgi:alpha-beta hydrolase superfamily lysophospholipase
VLGLSLTKVLFTVLVIVAVWRAFALIGSGASGGRRSHIDRWRQYHDQVEAHMEWAKTEGQPVVLLGHSLGGNIALGYALSDRTSPDLLVLSSPMMDAGSALQKAMARVFGGLLPTMRFRQGISGSAISRDPAPVPARASRPRARRRLDRAVPRDVGRAARSSWLVPEERRLESQPECPRDNDP